MLEPHEQAALDFAGAMAGEYLDSIGKTDLARLSAEQWQTFLEVICFNHLQKHNELKPCPF